MDIRDVVFQLVSTIAIGLRPGQHKTGPAHCSSRYMRLKKCQRDPKPCPLTRSLINCNIGDTLQLSGGHPIKLSDRCHLNYLPVATKSYPAAIACQNYLPDIIWQISSLNFKMTYSYIMSTRHKVIYRVPRASLKQNACTTINSIRHEAKIWGLNRPLSVCIMERTCWGPFICMKVQDRTVLTDIDCVYMYNCLSACVHATKFSPFSLKSRHVFNRILMSLFQVTYNRLCRCIDPNISGLR